MEPLINPGDSNLFGKRNLILTGTGDRTTPPLSFAGPLSIKSALEGQIDWRTPERRFRVWTDSFVVLNNGQHYTLSTEAEGRCRTFCAFFERGFVEQAVRSAGEEDETLLDEPEHDMVFGFFERLTPLSSPVGLSLGRLARAVSQRTTPDRLDGLFHELSAALAWSALSDRAEPKRLDRARASTREEIHRRLLRARAAIEDDLAADWALGRMAAAAAMAPHHFARCFSQCFGETPHNFLRRRRLERARALLGSGRLSVTQICLEVGYQSLGSFSAAYRAYFGAPPSQSLNRTAQSCTDQDL